MKKIKKFVKDHKTELIAEATLAGIYVFGLAVGYYIGSRNSKNARGLVNMVFDIPEGEIWSCVHRGNTFSVAPVAEALTEAVSK